MSHIARFTLVVTLLLVLIVIGVVSIQVLGLIVVGTFSIGMIIFFLFLIWEMTRPGYWEDSEY